MRQDQEEAASEDRCLLRIAPLIRLDELEDEVDVEALLQLDLELFLHLADDTDQVEKCVLHVDVLRRDRPVKVLIEDFLYERVAGRVKLLQ